MINLKLQYVVCWALLIVLNVVQAEQPISTLSVEELKYLAPQIKAAEKSLHNIKIESEAWVEEKNDLYDPCAPWERTPTYISSTAWFEGNRVGKARVDFHKEVLKWENGPAPCFERNYSASFDGQYGRYINNSTSHSGKVFHVNKYRILDSAPDELRSRWYQKMVGINASLNFHFGNEEGEFSSLFQRASDPNFAIENPELEIAYQKLGGVESISISVKGKRLRKSWCSCWWLDLTRGFALLKHQTTRNDEEGNELLLNSIEVTKLDQVAKNIWWPLEVHFIRAPLKVGNPWKRIVYRATKVVANDPNFRDSIFTVPIPEGYLVDEAEYKTTYRGPSF